MGKNKPDFTVFKCEKCNELRRVPYINIKSIRYMKCPKCMLPMKKLFQFSPSRMNTFAKCEWKTKFKYVDKIEEKASLYLGIDVGHRGQVLHQAYKIFFSIMMAIGCDHSLKENQLQKYFMSVLQSVMTVLKTPQNFQAFYSRFGNFARFQENRYKILHKHFKGNSELTWKYFKPILREIWCETAEEDNFRCIIDAILIIPAGLLENEKDELCFLDYKTGYPKGSIDKKGKMQFNNQDKRQLVLEALCFQRFKYPENMKKLQKHFKRIRYICNLYTGVNEKYPQGNAVWGEIKYNKDGKGARSFTAANKWFGRMKEAFKSGMFKCKGNDYICQYCEYDWYCVKIRPKEKQK